ncbi:hypothetical protein [Actinomadura sp. HBU206391]|uniref:hypothetical protein n=1 Tax=Actinomadura sp. HBU206391 TaxID=2731692 RepID=UPI00164F7F73|nr:hypothetical protein [Actinomadura sp. HBU206391]MBC6461713.1 hypothetical protein [Actinomadura sp. HBU206391]
MEGNGQFGYRLLWAVDVEKYSRRDARAQLLAQTELNGVLTDAAAAAGLDRGDWKTESRGDGELAVLPPHVDVAHAVGAFTRQMEVALADLNDGRPVLERLRLRLAMHYGTLTPGPFGYAGQAPIVTSRLLDGRPLRQRLAQDPDQDLALAVSASLYNDVIMGGFCPLDPACFTSFRIAAKGTIYQGYLYQAAERAQAESTPARDERPVGMARDTPRDEIADVSDAEDQGAVVLFLNRAAR